MQREEWPVPGSIAVVDEGETDGLGRQRFTLLWWQDGERRGQCFFAAKEDILRGMAQPASGQLSLFGGSHAA